MRAGCLATIAAAGKARRLGEQSAALLLFFYVVLDHIGQHRDSRVEVLTSRPAETEQAQAEQRERARFGHAVHFAVHFNDVAASKVAFIVLANVFVPVDRQPFGIAIRLRRAPV